METGLIIKVVLGMYSVLSTLATAYFGYQQQKLKSQAREAENETKAELRRNEQSQDMLKFWVGEFNDLKEEWKNRESKLKEEKKRLREENDSLRDEIDRLEEIIDELEEQ